jgi:GH15 family glucan-1,4-alpha-glucosidase
LKTSEEASRSDARAALPDCARRAGYVPIGDYAVVGDGRTAALVARDGSIDWLCVPRLDSPSVFGRLLDAERGGAFTLAPSVPCSVARRYRPHTNVLETTYRADGGAVRITDALTVSGPGLAPHRELARRVEGLAGRLPMRWRVEPRFGYGRWPTRVSRRHGVPVATAHTDALALVSWSAGEAVVQEGSFGAAFEVREGEQALLVLAFAHQEPLILPDRQGVESRIEATSDAWNRWLSPIRYHGPWAAAVERSALALKMLIAAPTGAIAAATTTSLPEVVGGERNWDYRFCWIRDASFTLESLLDLGFHDEAHAFAWWFLQATQRSHPVLGVLYRLDGGSEADERQLDWTGYRGSSPVRIGNAAVDQLQLGIYGVLLETFAVYARRGYPIDADTGRRLSEVADRVCAIWRERDCGIWEVRQSPRHFTHSKLMCWVALDRAVRLAGEGRIPGRSAGRWREEREAIVAFIEKECWSESAGAYARSVGSDDLDASVLLMARMGYPPGDGSRFGRTVDAIRDRLGRGPLLRRYGGEDGLEGEEGCFLTCSFWLVRALALAGRRDEAACLMEDLLAKSNDLGLYAEEMDASTGEMLGNYPQGLVHLALIEAARELGEPA